MKRKVPGDPVVKPWFYDRSQFVRSEEERVWRGKHASDVYDAREPFVTAEDPPAVPTPVVAMPPRVVAEPPLAELPIVISPAPEKSSLPSSESMPKETSPRLGLWQRFWKKLTG